MFQLCTRLPINDATQFRLPLVVKLLAFCDADLEFDAPSLDVNTSYYDRHSFGGGCLVQLVDFLPVQKEFAGTQRVMVCTIAMRVRRDVRIEQPGLSFPHANVRVFQLNATIEDALYLSPR